MNTYVRSTASPTFIIVCWAHFCHYVWCSKISSKNFPLEFSPCVWAGYQLCFRTDYVPVFHWYLLMHLSLPSLFNLYWVIWVQISFQNCSNPVGFAILAQSFCAVKRCLSCRYLKKSVLGRRKLFLNCPNDFIVPFSNDWWIYLSPYSDHLLNPISNWAGIKFLIEPMFVNEEIGLGNFNRDCISLQIFRVDMVHSPISVFFREISRKGSSDRDCWHRLFSMLSHRVSVRSLSHAVRGFNCAAQK